MSYKEDIINFVCRLTRDDIVRYLWIICNEINKEIPDCFLSGIKNHELVSYFEYQNGEKNMLVLTGIDENNRRKWRKIYEVKCLFDEN